MVVLFPPPHVGHPLGLAPEAAPEGLGLPLCGPGEEVVPLLGSQGFWQHQVLRELAARAAGNTVVWEGMTTHIGQHAPIFLPGEPPPRQRSLGGHSL